MTENKTQEITEESKRGKLTSTIGTNISENRKIIETMLSSPEILTAMNKFNYTQEKLSAILSLIDQASDAQAAQKQEQGEAKTAAAEYRKLREDAYEIYSDYRTLSQYIFKNDETAYKALQLNSSRSKAFGVWSEKAIQFYKNALGNESIKNDLIENGITEELLNQGSEKLLKTINYKINADKEKFEAITSTEERDEKVDEMNEAISKLKAFAKIALKRDKELRRRVGL